MTTGAVSTGNSAALAVRNQDRLREVTEESMVSLRHFSSESEARTNKLLQSNEMLSKEQKEILKRMKEHQAHHESVATDLERKIGTLRQEVNKLKSAFAQMQQTNAPLQQRDNQLQNLLLQTHQANASLSTTSANLASQPRPRMESDRYRLATRARGSD